MQDLLFLAHRIPYPPDKGDKIRSFHMLEGLAQHYRVHLGAFIDDPADTVHVERLRAYCQSLYLPRLRPWVGQLRGLPEAAGGAPLSLARYRHTRFARWVAASLRRHPIQAVYTFSSAMGRYGLTAAPRPVRRVMDFVDVDSEKWRQYADQHGGAMRWIYAREYRTLAGEEARLAAAYDASVLVSEDEAALFRRAHPGVDAQVHAIGNGVDLAYFDPGLPHENPYATGETGIVFTGAMDYQANIDGVTWFCREVWPAVRVAAPNARFYIVGQRPAPAVQALAREPGVVVTGRVPDVRPFLAHAAVVCAPLRVARGIQNKVLEALAMGRPVVGTAAAWEGLGTFDALLGERLDDPAQFAHAVLARMRQSDDDAPRRRAWLRDRFSWSRAHDQCLALLSSPGSLQAPLPSQTRLETGAT